MKTPPAARLATPLAFLIGAALLAACGGGGSRSTPTSTPSGEGRSVPIGVWGGPDVAVNVTSTGAEIEFDCASGTIDHPMMLDASGRFSASGTYVQGHGGPSVPGPQDSHPALYSGSVVNGNMSFTVTETDKGQTIGTFTAVEGASPRIVRCL